MTDWAELKRQVNLTVRPLDEWPGKLTFSREKGPFGTDVKNTLNTLKLCLSALQAKSIVLEIAIKPNHWRQDGLPRADATASHPGVILSFQSKHGPLRFAFDKFKSWENNLRAIAMHLDHLRLAGLYGVGSDGQQYRGWVALPPAPAAGATLERWTGCSAKEVAAAEWIWAHSSVEVREILYDADRFRAAYHEAARKLHPDMGGNSEQFQRLTDAADILRRKHNMEKAG